MRIAFEHPLILLLIPAGVALLVFSMRFMNVRSKELKIKQVILHSIVYSLIILALSGVTVLRNDNKMATIFVVDASESVKEHKDTVTEFIQEALKTRQKSDYVGIVAFGRTPAVENFLSDEILFRGIQSNIEANATDIEAAVRTALSLIPDGYAKRIVIISDGAENSGDLSDTYKDIAISDCEIKVMELPKSQSAEVYVSNVEVPKDVGLGERFNITVEIESNVHTEAYVNLYQGRELTATQKVKIIPGTNLFQFQDMQKDTGLKTYKVTVTSANDTTILNNEFSAFTNISKKQTILLIESTAGEASNLSKLLTSLNRDNQVIDAANAPDNINDLLEYSTVCIINTPIQYLKEGFLNNLSVYVGDYGRGLIVCGGKNAFGMGDYKDTVLEELLPVDMEIKAEEEIPSMSVIMVIDHSGSMGEQYGGYATKLDAAKNAAMAAVKTLRESDKVGVITFDDAYQHTVPLKEAGDQKSIINAISTISMGGGTSIYPAVNAAVDDLIKDNSAIKHIILLTDGEDGNERYAQLIRKINDNSITLSTVSIGQGANDKLLHALAEQCGGRMYAADGTVDLPKLFMQEIYLAGKSFIVEGEFAPTLSSNDEITEFFKETGMPTLKAYIGTTIKAGAVELLHDEQEDHPVLAYRQYGLGKTVAWTSDVTGNWSGEFVANELINSTLWNNIFRMATEDHSIKDAYAEISQNGETAEVTYRTETFSSASNVTAVVTDENGVSSELTLLPKKPGIYSSTFNMTSPGVYAVSVKQSEGSELLGTVTAVTTKQYSQEYTFNTNDGLLEDYVRHTGGTMITSPDMVFTGSYKSVKSMKDITTLLLVLALVLFVYDIAYRRFRFRIFPEKASVKKVAASEPNSSNATQGNTLAPVNSSDSSTNANMPNGSTGKNATNNGSKVPANKKSKSAKPEMLDTSQLLNRMKK